MEPFSKLFELFSKSYKVAFTTMLVTVALSIGVMEYMFGVSLEDFTTFVVHKQKSIDKVAHELIGINSMIDKAELESHKNQQELLKIIQNRNNKKIIQNKNNEKIFNKLLNLSNENQDIIRAQLEFGRIYATLVETQRGDEENYKQLSKLYQALLLITLDDPLNVDSKFNKLRQKAKENGEKICDDRKAKDTHICEAKSKLSELRGELNDFPKIVRDNIKIEVYRYLSYCCARALETDKQAVYTDRAEQLLKDKPNMFKDDPRLYRRQYYWIDYSRMMLLVKEGKPGFEEEAKSYFKKLKSGFVDSESNFLKHKLMQHQHLIPEEGKLFWLDLIKEADYN